MKQKIPTLQTVMSFIGNTYFEFHLRANGHAQFEFFSTILLRRHFFFHALCVCYECIEKKDLFVP